MKKKEKKEKVKKDSFLKSTRKEMKNVSWPDGKSVFKYSVATLSLIVFFMVFFVLINLVSAYIKGLFV